MPQPDKPSRIGPNYIQKRVLGGFGEANSEPSLREGALIEEPDANGGVLLGDGGSITPLAGVQLPNEAWAGGADLIKEVVVLEGLWSGDFLYGGLYRLLDHCCGFGEGLA